MFYHFARRFVAGPALGHALAFVRQDNLLGIYGIVNFLGEHCNEQASVANAVNEYKNAAVEIKRRSLDAELSVKLTQLGLLISEAVAADNLKDVLETGAFVWIDMESSERTDTTIRIYSELLRNYKNVGITLQAYMGRTESDITTLAAKGATVRLVKGAYKEKPGILVGGRKAVGENYGRLLEILFEHGGRFAVATHDDALIERAMRLSESYDAKPEFQALLGVRERLQARLAAEGYRVGEYIPYGTHWRPYFKRRIHENNKNALLAVKDFFTYDHERLARL